MLQRLDQWLKKSKWRWLLLIVGALFVSWLFFMGSVTLMEFSESSEFCSSCHVMSPEHTAYMNSPHAKVECGTCHIGPGAYHAFEAKVRSAHYVWSYPLGLYEKPIPSPITSLRPAEVVCEQCHWPEKFYDDRLVTIPDYAQDEKNSLTETALVVNTGGGPRYSVRVVASTGISRTRSTTSPPTRSGKISRGCRPRSTVLRPRTCLPIPT